MKLSCNLWVIHQPLKKLITIAFLIVVVSVSGIPAAAVSFVEEGTSEAIPQQLTVTGKVIDKETGEGMPGVNIQIQGREIGAITNTDGSYTLSAPGRDAVLVFSFIGYQSQTVPLSGRTSVNVTLVSDVALLNEVVVIGYGTIKKATQTGAITSVQSAELATYTSPDLSTSLAGKMPGLRVMQIGGEPGKYDSRVDIRGWGNMLVVIDGVPRDDFQRLDPNSIASVSILKDASAAVYGVKAANGVMLITTKKGEAGKIRINYNTTHGVQRMSDYPVSITNSIDNLILLNEAAIVAGTPIPYPDYLKYDGTDPNFPNVNYWDLVFRQNAPISRNNVSISGGTDKINYRFFVSNFSQEDVWKQLDPENISGYNRYNFGANISAELYKGLVASFIVSGMADKRWQPYITTDGKTFRQNYMEPSYIPVYANNNPDLYNDGLADFNPLAIIDGKLTGYYDDRNKNYETTFSLTYDLPFIKGLQLKGLYAFDSRSRTTKAMRRYYNEWKYDAAKDEYKATGNNQPSQLQYDSNQRYNSLAQLSASYRTVIANSHNVTGLLLGEFRENTGTGFRAQKDFVVDVLDQLNAGVSDNAVASGTDRVPSLNLGLVGRVNYDYNTKYLAEFSFRYDGSSLFPKEGRWGFFPAFQAGWRVSEEPFFKDRISFINQLKLRVSHGVMGDDQAASGFEYLEGYIYPATGTYASYLFSANKLTTGSASKGLTNKNITWYTATTTNFGLDLDIMQSLIFMQLDVFQRRREGLLARRASSLPSEFGATFPQENLESDKSTGFEIELGHKKVISRDFDYSVVGNFTWARSMWLYREIAPYGSSYSEWRGLQGSANRWKNMRWGYGFVGQFQNQEEVNTSPSQNANGHAALFPGDVRYEDWNGDGMISSLDEHPVGRDNDAEIFYGLDINSRFKGFAVTLFFQGAANYTLRPTAQMEGPLMWGRNSIDIFMDRWHHEDPLDFTTPWVPGKFPISRTNFGFAGNKLVSEYTLQDIWYLRLKNVEFSYTLPARWTSKIYMQSLRLFANGTNLLTMKSKEAYFDPEKRLDGGEAESGYKYPLMKNLNFGIDITF
jgi:TonB-linked SusC/RagA family outer membrane protein